MPGYPCCCPGEPPPPVFCNASFDHSIDDHTVTFTDTSSTSDPIVSWLWDFGDLSTPSTAQNPIHTFPGTGPYDVLLTVTTATQQCFAGTQLIFPEDHSICCPCDVDTEPGQFQVVIDGDPTGCDFEPCLALFAGTSFLVPRLGMSCTYNTGQLPHSNPLCEVSSNVFLPTRRLQFPFDCLSDLVGFTVTIRRTPPLEFLALTAEWNEDWRQINNPSGDCRDIDIVLPFRGLLASPGFGCGACSGLQGVPPPGTVIDCPNFTARMIAQ
jgi:hypothetical protein